jgi:hypothetical protein
MIAAFTLGLSFFPPLATISRAQTPASTAPATNQKHFENVEARGDQGMGFSHQMTGHHFRLLPDGGAIEVEAKEANDAASRQAIRAHLTMIAGRFAAGDFSVPMFIHATAPPGMGTMQRLKQKITYTAEETPRGAQVRIMTKDPEAIRAIHQFLRFQIVEHRTGDSEETPKPE